jgi:NAD(P)-dependent dehydrogenase (short-subunit alcohol dehydrogenase family)
VGATSGIGRAIAERLARADFDVTAVGRDAARGAEVVASMSAAGRGAHTFVALDGSSLGTAYRSAGALARDGAAIDVLVLTQGIATTQGRTETAEGLDVKLATHYFARAAFVDALLPALRRGPAPRVLSVLSAGVHGVYPHWADDTELRAHYTLKNAADAAGLYTDLAMDALSRDPDNARVTFIHAAPGMVATSWGSEMPWWLRPAVRGLLRALGKPPADCAEFMVAPLLHDTEPYGQLSGWRLVGEHAQVVAPTRGHAAAAREHVWGHTRTLLDAAKARALH